MSSICRQYQDKIWYIIGPVWSDTFALWNSLHKFSGSTKCCRKDIKTYARHYISIDNMPFTVVHKKGNKKENF